MAEMKYLARIYSESNSVFPTPQIGLEKGVSLKTQAINSLGLGFSQGN